MSDVTATAFGGVLQRVVSLEEAREDVDGWLDDVKPKLANAAG
jgi:hypothetical protein